MAEDPLLSNGPAARPGLRVADIARMDYALALETMRSLAAQAPTAPHAATLLLTEHEPVITLGRRAGAGEITCSAQVLARRGVVVHRIERGGLATVHGPGQLMIYPVMDLNRLGLGVKETVHQLEGVAIDVLAGYSVAARRRADLPGVWVGDEKIVSIGLAIKRGITLHGLALNNSIDLRLFDLITPCGLSGVRMTSLQHQTGQPADPAQLRSAVVRHFAARMGLQLLA